MAAPDEDPEPIRCDANFTFAMKKLSDSFQTVRGRTINLLEFGVITKFRIVFVYAGSRNRQFPIFMHQHCTHNIENARRIITGKAKVAKVFLSL